MAPYRIELVNESQLGKVQMKPPRGLPVIDRNFITLLTLLGRLLVRNESAHLSSKHFFVRLSLAN